MRSLIVINFMKRKGTAMAAIPFVLIAILTSGFPQQPQSEEQNVPVITIERTGGFAGVDDLVSVFANGKVLDEGGKIRHIRLTGLEGFIRSVEKVGAPAPDEATVPQRVCSDCFVCTITVLRGEAAKKLVVEEPIRVPSEKGSEDAKAIRDFLSVVFSQSHSE